MVASYKIQYLRTCHLSIIVLGLVSRGTSLWICFGSPFTSKVVVCEQSCDFVPHNYEMLKWLSLLPILMQESFWWRQCSDMYIISLFPYHHTPPPPFSPSLISLMFLWTLSTMFTYLPLLPLRQQSPIYVRNRINTNLGTSFACLLTVSPSLCCLETKIFWEKGPSPYSSHIL